MSGAQLRIIHVIDGLTSGNHGIVEAALGTAKILSEIHSCRSELWYPADNVDSKHRFNFRDAEVVGLPRYAIQRPGDFAVERGVKIENTVVVTHGCWRSPTMIGRRMKRAGYRWVYVPHGMLEPWSLKQKSMLKKIYGFLREGPCARKADLVRATAVPEERNLRRMFRSVSLVSHGISVIEHFEPGPQIEKIRVLFLGRFHPKKNAALLAQAWLNSRLCDDEKFELILVGNDDGDLESLDSVIGRTPCSNLRRSDPVYEAEKLKLFRECQFFALPSHSEGFPVALLEGMGAGLIPIISSGCNLPEAIESGLAVTVAPELESIVSGLNSIAEFADSMICERQRASREFIQERFSLQAISSQQLKLYSSLFD